MGGFPKKLQAKLEERKQNNALRSLGLPSDLIDFSSNDYLGFARNKHISEAAKGLLTERNIQQNGATGSRLISGNYELYNQVEVQLARDHKAATALLFNSGYDANIGFFSAVPQRGDVVFYDEFIHASIRDGIAMGLAKSYKFKHKHLDDLKVLINRVLAASTPLNQQEVGHHPETERSRSLQPENRSEVYIVTESVFSMDGDTPDLQSLADFCASNHYHLVVDEAHATGVFGSDGQGLVYELGLQNKVFAQIITFGKAMGCHGAAILGSALLKTYVINFARSFIYTTGLPPHSVATISAAYHTLKTSQSRKVLQENIAFFREQLQFFNLTNRFIPSTSAIHCCIISGNERVKKVSQEFQNQGYSIKAILSPTVPKGQERLRFCLHSYNTKEEITTILGLLKDVMKRL